MDSEFEGVSEGESMSSSSSSEESRVVTTMPIAKKKIF